MNKIRVLLPLFLFSLSAAFCAAAQAQVEMYPGQDVTVNPQAAGTRVLLYPGGQYMRVVPPLMVPGARPYAPIHLHRPVHHVRTAAAPRPPAADTNAQANTNSGTAAGAALSSSAATPSKKPARTADLATTSAASNTAPATGTDTSPAEDSAPVSSAATIPFAFDSSSPPPVSAQTGSKPAKPQAPPAQTQTASAELPPANTSPKPVQRSIAPTPQELATHAGLVKRSEIIFEAGASDPAPSTLGAIKSLAGTLAAAINDGAQRIQLEAYGGARGDKSSDARRLSLKRALSVRQLLIDDGVPAEKIDVRAMGGADDKGPTDRVDVFVRAG